MRRVKQISIKNYITGMIVAIIVLLSMVMLLFINILANEAIRADIQTELVNEVRENGRNIIYENGQVEITEDFVDQEDGIHFLVVNRDGEVLQGEYPQEVSKALAVMPQGERMISGRLHSFHIGARKYYLLDRIQPRVTREAGQIVYIRCIVRKADISSKYELIRTISYVSIPIILLVAVGFSYLFAKSLSEPIRELCQVAQSIRCDDDLSNRMEYKGHFYEIGVLSDANNQMLEKLEHSFEIQKRFNSDVAHELRSPIAIVLAQCEYASKHLENQEDYKDVLDTIYRHTKREDKMVQQLLRLSRLEQGKISMEREWANIEDIVQAVCEDEEQRTDKTVRMHLDLAQTEAYMDVSFMTMVIQNLIHNAIIYSRDEVQIEVRTKQWENGICIQVQDHGIGISESDQKNVFHAFFRVNEARNGDGAGLGLSIVEQIVELHGGKIKVESKLGEGSIFTIYIPGEH